MANPPKENGPMWSRLLGELSFDYPGRALRPDQLSELSFYKARALQVMQGSICFSFLYTSGHGVSFRLRSIAPL